MQLVVAEWIADAVRERLAAVDQPIELAVVSRTGETAADLSEATAFFRGFIDRGGVQRVVEAAPRLRWLHSASAGVDGFLDPAWRERGIVVTNSAGVYAVPIAEWVLWALLMIVKRGREMEQRQQARQWDDAPRFEELGGKTLTILGSGGIGREIAKRAAAFDMRVWGVNRSGRPVEHVARVWHGDGWRDALPATDMLVICTPLTDATHHLIGARELAMLPRSAWVLNIARGAVIDEAALIAALQSGTIAGAALDTFEQEPLPADSPLWMLPNVFVSPHHSPSSPRSQERVLDLFMDNLQRFINGDELRNVVDFHAGY